jgi:hypothetical protein
MLKKTQNEYTLLKKKEKERVKYLTALKINKLIY